MEGADKSQKALDAGSSGERVCQGICEEEMIRLFLEIVSANEDHKQTDCRNFEL